MKPSVLEKLMARRYVANVAYDLVVEYEGVRSRDADAPMKYDVCTLDKAINDLGEARKHLQSAIELSEAGR